MFLLVFSHFRFIAGVFFVKEGGNLRGKKHFLESNFILKNIFHHHGTFNLNCLNFENFFSFPPRTFIFQKLVPFSTLYITFLTTLSYLLCINQGSSYVNFQFFNFFFILLYINFLIQNCSHLCRSVSFPKHR